MIISKTPFRISLFGGGTDFPQWYKLKGGAVVSTSIDKYCYITCRYLPPFFKNKHRIVWSHIETVSNISEILHPAIRGGLKYLGFNENQGIEIHHQGDLPARSGMGSSSSFILGMLNALTALRGEKLTKSQLAKKAIELEQNFLKESVGSQDQVSTAFGGFNYINFQTSGEVTVDSLNISMNRLKELEAHLNLVYTGTSRNGTSIAKKTIQNLSTKEPVLKEISKIVERGIEVLTSNQPIEIIGDLLEETWKKKCELNPETTNPAMNRIYQNAKQSGAIGGKLLGSGGSGFFLFFVPPQKKLNFQKSLQSLLHVPFKFESDGSQIIFNSDNVDPYESMMSDEKIKLDFAA